MGAPPSVNNSVPFSSHIMSPDDEELDEELSEDRLEDELEDSEELDSELIEEIELEELEPEELEREELELDDSLLGELDVLLLILLKELLDRLELLELSSTMVTSRGIASLSTVIA